MKPSVGEYESVSEGRKAMKRVAAVVMAGSVSLARPWWRW